MTMLMAAMKGPFYNDLFSIMSIDAAYRFYRSKCEEDSIKRRGKTSVIAKQKRTHERSSRVSLHYM